MHTQVFFYLKGTASRLGFRDEAAAPDKNALNKWVNEWVSTKTHNKLRSALPPGSWNDWVLVNAVYLKADWMQPFSLDATQAAEFTVSAEEKLANVLFMGEQFEELPYTEDKELGVEMISLNYKVCDWATEHELNRTSEKNELFFVKKITQAVIQRLLRMTCTSSTIFDIIMIDASRFPSFFRVEN